MRQEIFDKTLHLFFIELPALIDIVGAPNHINQDLDAAILVEEPGIDQICLEVSDGSDETHSCLILDAQQVSDLISVFEEVVSNLLVRWLPKMITLGFFIPAADESEQTGRQDLVAPPV